MAARILLALLLAFLCLGASGAQDASVAAVAPALRASPAASVQVDDNFPQDGVMKSIIEPIDIGLDAFAARIAALRARGREPLGLVLGGGSARAYAHIGVLQVLEEAGIYPDFIIGNSMGAVLGMLYSAGVSPSTIARIVTTISPDSRLDLILPTHGGLINAERFVAAMKSLVGDIDLSETKIPILIMAEDLRSRRQVRLAAGPFSRVMATSFAMPAIFEPVPFGDFLLVDGGLTNIIPVDLAAQYSSSLIVSTALYDRSMDFGNPISVISRAIDIGKTRAGLKGIIDENPLVIRNRVEDISYMQFADPVGIIELGRRSAEAVIGDIVQNLGPAYCGNAISPALSSARKAYDASIPGALAALKRGAIPPTLPTSRSTLIFKLTDEFETSPLALDSQAYAGIEAFTESGKTRRTMGALFGLAQDTGRQWGLAFGLTANPADTLMIQANLRLWGDFGSWSSYVVNPDSFEALGTVSWPSKGEDLLFVPRIDGSLLYHQKTGLLTWSAGTRFAFETAWGGKGGGSLAPSLEGILAAKGGAFIEGSDGSFSCGPEWNLKLGLAWPDIAGLRCRAAGRWDATGLGISLRKGDAYRGSLPSGSAPLVSVLNLDLVWLANALEFAAGESVLVSHIEAGLYFDYLTLTGGASDFGSFAVGLGVNLTASIAGLASYDLSLFFGFDKSGFPILGLRSSRLFPAFQ
ncbi:MAG: patatin-like phospholipase family protein [Spirochaetes bacterium]|nr:patatin-like phospholipase family protein [Spirochaetota bacterium]